MAQTDDRTPAPPRPDRGPFARASGPWTDRVSFATEGSYAFRPRHIVCEGSDATQEAFDLVTKATGKDPAKPISIIGEYSLVPYCSPGLMTCICRLPGNDTSSCVNNQVSREMPTKYAM